MAVKTGLRLALRGSTRSCSWVHSLATSQCLHRLTSLLVANGYLPDIVKEQQCLAGCPKEDFGKRRTIKTWQTGPCGTEKINQDCDSLFLFDAKAVAIVNFTFYLIKL